MAGVVADTTFEFVLTSLQCSVTLVYRNVQVLRDIGATCLPNMNSLFKKSMIAWSCTSRGRGMIGNRKGIERWSECRWAPEHDPRLVLE